MFDRLGPALVALFPFIVMFLVTSVTTLRERSSGTLERLLAMPMGKLDFLLGYALAFGLIAALQSALAVAVSVGLLDLEVARPGLAAHRGGGGRRRARRRTRAVRLGVRADRVPGGAVHAGGGDPADPAVRPAHRPRPAARRAQRDLRPAPAVVRRRRDAAPDHAAPRPPRSGPTWPWSAGSWSAGWRSARRRCAGVLPDPDGGRALGVPFAPCRCSGNRCSCSRAAARSRSWSARCPSRPASSGATCPARPPRRPSTRPRGWSATG